VNGRKVKSEGKGSEVKRTKERRMEEKKKKRSEKAGTGTGEEKKICVKGREEIKWEEK
jgi:hypothetical protein